MYNANTMCITYAMDTLGDRFNSKKAHQKKCSKSMSNSSTTQIKNDTD